jgi:hypothetical protein
MPGADPAPTPALVLAAIERAALHRGDAARPVPMWAILAQLHVRRRSSEARLVGAQLATLGAAGAVREQRRHGVRVWALTRAGAAQLSRARRRAAVVLPESPQHEAWRHARTVAALEIDRMRTALTASAEDAVALAEAEPPAHSEQWFALAERLRRDAWVLGAASHCLYEWQEPDDRRADLDDGPRGRRNVALWRAWR